MLYSYDDRYQRDGHLASLVKVESHSSRPTSMIKAPTTGIPGHCATLHSMYLLCPCPVVLIYILTHLLVVIKCT